VRNKIVILVDDGLATGATMAAAAAALKRQDPARLIVAVPVSSPETCDAFRNFVDDIVCAVTPEPFYAVGLWYEDFSQTTDDEVHDLLERARREADAHLGTAEGARGRIEERTVHVAADHVSLEGAFAVPRAARGVVLFAHGSGSSRHSPRNRYVARELHAAGLATLLVDLLTADEEREDARMRHLRFDIGLLAGRLIRAIEWLAARPETRALKVGLFGASTGGGAALVAAAQRPDAVGAVVSRGGRPDLAGDALPRVRAPTLLIVGGDDEQVIELNEAAMTRMRGPVRLEIIPGASHLFEESGALERVAQLARGWFAQHLARQAGRAAEAQDVRPSMGGEAPGAAPL
jgi:putative phosphoribosyl transferase